MIYYQEIQRFKQRWLMVLAIVIAVVVLYAIFNDLDTLRQRNSDMVLVIGLTLLVLALALPILLLQWARLKTTLSDAGAEVKFHPFINKGKFFSWDNVRTAEVITYNPIKDYGGWGIRIGRKGTAYNVSGNQGLQLVLMNGKNILIGTQTPQDLHAALKQIPALANKTT